MAISQCWPLAARQTPGRPHHFLAREVPLGKLERVNERRQQGERRLGIGGHPPSAERRRGGRRSGDLPGRRGVWLYLQVTMAAALGVGTGLALSPEAPPTNAIAPAVARPVPRIARRALDHGDVVSMGRELDGLTPTDLLLDADVAANWLLAAEDLQARLRTEQHPDTRTELLALAARLRALGVSKSPTP